MTPPPTNGLTVGQLFLLGSCVVACAIIVVAVVARSGSVIRRGGDACQGRTDVMYTRPPDGYRPPTMCEVCREGIRLTVVPGGVMWLHVDPAAGRTHQVVMRPAGWWDTKTGRIVHDAAAVHNLDDLIGGDEEQR